MKLNEILIKRLKKNQRKKVDPKARADPLGRRLSRNFANPFKTFEKIELCNEHRVLDFLKKFERDISIKLKKNVTQDDIPLS